MVFKRVLSLSLLLALAGGAFVASEQSAEARCCRQRNRGCCNNGGYNGGYSYGYTNAGYSNCGSCSSGTCNTGMAPGATYDGTAPAPAPAAAPLLRHPRRDERHPSRWIGEPLEQTPQDVKGL